MSTSFSSPTPTELAALRTAHAAVQASRSPNSHIIDTAIFALGAAQLLQSPETAAELDRLRKRVAQLEEARAAGTTAPDFYEPGHTYVSAKFPEYGWQFRCDTVTTHPEDGERTALGWRFFRGEWEAYAYGEGDWDIKRGRLAVSAAPAEVGGPVHAVERLGGMANDVASGGRS